MINPTVDNVSDNQRICLRVPMRLPAAVIIEDKACKKVLISDLSSTGLSVFTSEDKNIPSVFDLRFRLRRFSMPVTISMEVRHRTPTRDGIRIGCEFLPVSEKAQRVINNYIDRSLNFTFARAFIFIAAFLCCIDVFWKLAARIANAYYMGTEFGRSAVIYAPNLLSEAAFVCYAILSFSAVFVVAHRTPIKGKPSFIVSATLLAAVFVYISGKNIFCVQYKLWHTACSFAKAFFWWEVLIIVCVAASIVVSLGLLRKMNFTLKVMSMYTEGKPGKPDTNS